MKSTLISLRIGTPFWFPEEGCEGLLRSLALYTPPLEEVALFTSFTHPPVPLERLRQVARRAGEVMPRFRELGLRAGINLLSVYGHLDENLDNSLQGPFQRMMDLDGNMGQGSFCPLDPGLQDYARQGLIALAKAEPDFIWIDDDLRLEGHGPVGFACFCDRCLARFGEETGRSWTRASLRQALTGRESLALRRAWLAHNRKLLRGTLELIRAAVDEVNPALQLGLMSGEATYSGLGFGELLAALSSEAAGPACYRPGGGFYQDHSPTDLVDKAHGIGRQVAFAGPAIFNIQSELENFPYCRLTKSTTTVFNEVAAYIAAGCTGTALNLLGGLDEQHGLGEYEDYLKRMADVAPFLAKEVALFGRSGCEGLWPAITSDVFATTNPDGDWLNAPAWGSRAAFAQELSLAGLPLAYQRESASLSLLSGDNVLAFSKEALTELLSGGVLLDAPALLHLQELGLGEHTGFTVTGQRADDTLEIFGEDELSGGFPGWERDCRQSFRAWWQPGWLLEPLSDAARSLSRAVDYTGKHYGTLAGAFENSLGGRVAALGYYPWSYQLWRASSDRLKRLARWLSREELPAWCASHHRLPLWVRRDTGGNPALFVLNASLDAAENCQVAVKAAGPARYIPVSGTEQLLEPGAQLGGYTLYKLPLLAPWTPALLAFGD